ncbi:signal peptidase II [Marinithermus hydrothermalis]|uniref:Lipoprotein signal peptidase n=1 Tax=Marinithermus hydrothermalis (strain DSM 14884 / JCM 11576 / T1) TaxID=869210 RepID=F2NKN4_MARHT|nr:signal peptidase II [Marinithermus hydrothermalis]AEB10797.1 Lipoprotein signal peptidase [Marinithermus hydrothermalis DSM 14884]
MPVVLVPLLIVLDQTLKLWALEHLDAIPDPFLPGLYLTLVRNTGMAFGLLPGQAGVLAWVSLAVGGGLLVYLARARPGGLRETALSLLAAGALGNAIDRIGRGWVVDYLDIGPGLWPVFNLADVCVVLGVLLLLLPSRRRPRAF